MGSYAPETRPSLVNQISWLEKHMETLLSLPPATTMRFVKNQTNSTTVPPADDVVAATESKKTTANTTNVQQQTRIKYNVSQLEKAKIARERHLKQLETRFPDSYRMLRYVALAGFLCYKDEG
jgi:hypothetical protein